MLKTAPHYLLFTEAKSSSHTNGFGNRWRFVLEEIGTMNRLEEADDEPDVHGERLQLLAVVRGLEALEQPSKVTLITSSKHVGRGIRRNLTQWKENDWHWERFDEVALVKDHDLWQRIDHAMQIHQIECRIWQFDPPHVKAKPSEAVEPETQIVSRPAAKFPGERPSVVKVSSSPKSFSDEKESARLRRSSTAIQETIGQCSRIDNALEKRIRPLGTGRAYGYAVN